MPCKAAEVFPVSSLVGLSETLRRCGEVEMVCASNEASAGGATKAGTTKARSQVTLGGNQSTTFCR
jgi:hypothetical protein